MVVTAVVAAVAVIAATGTFLWRYGAESKSQSTAKATAADVLVQQSRDAAAGSDPGDPYNALLLAMRAYRTQHTAHTRQLLAENYAHYGFADLIVPSYRGATSLVSLSGGGGPSVSADGQTVVSADSTGEQLVWQLAHPTAPRHTGRHENLTATAGNGALVAMTYSEQITPEQKQYGVGGPPVVLYDIRSGRAIRQLEAPSAGDRMPDLPDPGYGLPTFGGFPTDLPLPTMYAALAFDPTGKHVAAVTGFFGMGGRVLVWNAVTGKLERTLKGPADSPDLFLFTADGQGLICVGQNLSAAASSGSGGAIISSITTWDLTRPSPEAHSLLHLPWGNGQQLVDVSPDGGFAAVATSRLNGLSADTGVTLYRLPSGTATGPARQLPHDVAITGITVTAGGARVVPYTISTAALIVPSKPVSGVVRAFGPWQRLDTYGFGDGTTATLTGLGLNALVRTAGAGDPLRRIPPPPATATPTAASSSMSPAVSDVQRQFDALCKTVGDTTLPEAVEQKMPPGTYRGPLCA
jgi:hypothetical protein